MEKYEPIYLLRATNSPRSILVSLVTEPIPSKYLHRLTFWTRHSTEVRLELDKLGEEHEEEYKVGIGLI